MFNCSIVQDTVKSSHGVWKQSAECRSQDVTLRMGSNLLWCQFIICNILAACENLWFGAFFMWVGAVALQSPFMLKWIYQGTFHETHLGRALAAPRSPGSLVLAELASLGGQIGLWWPFQFNIIFSRRHSIKLRKTLPHCSHRCSSSCRPFSEGQLGQAWWTWWAVTSDKRSWRAQSSFWPRCWAWSDWQRGRAPSGRCPWNIGMRL